MSGDEVPFALPKLSLGNVTVLAAPIDAATAGRLVGRLREIRGVDAISVVSLSGGLARLVVEVGQPTALASEIREALGVLLSSCSIVDERIELRLNDPAHRSAPIGTRRSSAGRSDVRRSAASLRNEALDSSAFASPAMRLAMDSAVSGIQDLSILTFDLDQRYNGVAGSIHERLGHRSENLMGRPARAVVRPSTWPLLEPGYKAALAGETSTIEVPGLEPGDRLEATFTPVIEDQAVIGGMVVTRDVSHARRSALLVAQLQTVLDITFDQSPVAQALLSPEGRWLRVNARLTHILQRTEAELVTRSIFDVTHIEDVHRASELLHQLLTGARDFYELPKRFVDPDGRPIDVLVRMTLVRTPDDAPQGLVAQVLSDPT